MRTEPARPWAAMPIKEDKLTTTFFNASIGSVLGDGASWSDLWVQGRSIADITPDLFDTVPAHRLETDRGRWHRLSTGRGSWIQDIVGPLTVPVLISTIN
jgi:hypothetical protein